MLGGKALRSVIPWRLDMFVPPISMGESIRTSQSIAFCVSRTCLATDATMSVIGPDTTGTISGRHCATCMGALVAACCSSARAACTVADLLDESIDSSSFGTITCHHTRNTETLSE